MTVGKWRKRFLEDRLEGLAEGPRPGAPRTITDAHVEEVVTKTLEEKPKAATRWSAREMAEAVGLSRSTIIRIWRAFGLKPHQSGSFKLSTDPYFVEKVRDVVGLYMSPPEGVIVLSIDEKGQVQASDRTRPLLPMTPGRAERGTHDHIRDGTTSPFAALNVATGRVIGKCYQRHRSREFLEFLKEVDSQVTREPGVQIHIIMDNYGTHKTASVKRRFERHPEYPLHSTSTGGSWLDQVERSFAEITEKHIRRGAFRSVAALEKAIMDYLAAHDENPKPFVWTAGADLILDRVKRVCERISNSGHWRFLGRSWRQVSFEMLQDRAFIEVPLSRAGGRQPAQRPLDGRQVGELAADVGELPLRLPPDLGGCRPRPDPRGEQLLDLDQGEAQLLGTLDEPDEAHALRGVLPVAGWASGWDGQQPLPLMGAERLDVDPGLPRQLAAHQALHGREPLPESVYGPYLGTESSGGGLRERPAGGSRGVGSMKGLPAPATVRRPPSSAWPSRDSSCGAQYATKVPPG